MTRDLSWFNALPAQQGEAELLRCCGSGGRASRVAASRSFATTAELAGMADQVSGSLGPSGWLYASAAHPRSGEPTASPLSSREQGLLRP
jgi:2-oxo-4-hydroxy-4-carboxy-5-ureidoimidazoline decarboxylase